MRRKGARASMKKGDLRRAQILQASEKLFYLQGYESTSVDQILQALHLSKGGFYHHFESKEALLWAICEERASSCAQAIAKAVADCPGGASARINAMFDKNGLWRQDQTDFLGLLIRVGYRGGNLTLRERLKSRLYQLCLPIVDTIVADGVDSGEFLTPYPHGVGSLVLQLGLSFTDEIARLLAEEGPPDTARILEYLELYRYAVEQVLGAPFGSIDLYQMRYMADLCVHIWQKHLR